MTIARAELADQPMQQANHRRLKDIANVRMGQSPDSIYYNTEGKGIPFLQGCAQFGKVHPATSVYCTSPTKIAPRGSILFSVRAPVGEINIADRDYCIGRGLAAVVARGVDTKLLYYLLDYAKPQLIRIAQGSTFEAINSAELEQCLLPNPGNGRQQSAIAAVLSTVDRAIEQTEALIAKYQRIKTGLMHDLLTRGIDEHGQIRDPATHKFKPSPLGMIPKEWEVSKLGALAERITSGSRFWAAYYSVEGAKFIRIGDLTREHVNLRLDNLQHVDPPPGSEKDRTRLQTGDLLISVTADLGIIGVVPDDFGEAYINQHIALVRLNQEQVNPWWVGNFLAFHGSQQRIAQLNESGAKAGLNLPTVSSIPVAVPSLDEQNETAKTLRKADDLIAQEKAHLEKLQRLKAGLMQDLLTGRVSIEPLLKDRSGLAEVVS